MSEGSSQQPIAPSFYTRQRSNLKASARKMGQAITHTPSKPCHPGAFTQDRESSSTFASPTYLNKLIDYYHVLPPGQRSSATDEMAFKPFSFSDLPDPSWWTCDVRVEDVSAITESVKSAADALYGLELSGSNFDWGIMRAQPKYAQLWMANKILSIIDTDMCQLALGSFSELSLQFRTIDPARYEINSDTAGILDVLGQHRAKPMLAKFGQSSSSLVARTTASQSPSPRLEGGHDHATGIDTASGILEDADVRRTEAERSRLAEQAKVVRDDIATLAQNIHRIVQMRLAAAGTTAQPSTQSGTVVSPTRLNAANTTPSAPPPPVQSSSATPANHSPAIPLPNYREEFGIPFPVGSRSPHGTPPTVSQPSDAGAGSRGMAYVVGAAAAAWAGYELYKRSEGGYLDSVADSVASWWSGEHEEQ